MCKTIQNWCNFLGKGTVRLYSCINSYQKGPFLQPHCSQMQPQIKLNPVKINNQTLLYLSKFDPGDCKLPCVYQNVSNLVFSVSSYILVLRFFSYSFLLLDQTLDFLINNTDSEFPWALGFGDHKIFTFFGPCNL